MAEKIRPREELLQLVETINSDLHLTDMHIELASEERAKEMVHFLIQYFCEDEPLSKSLGAVMDEDRKSILVERHKKDNLSLLLISDISKEIIGVRTMKVESSKEQGMYTREIQSKTLQTIWTFLSHKDAEMNVYKYYDVDCAVHFVNLGIHKDFRNRGLASLLMKAALQFVRNIGLDPVCITGEGTSNYSQRIYERFEFEVLHTVKYEDYKVDGEVVFKNTGDNKTCKFYVKKL